MPLDEHGYPDGASLDHIKYYDLSVRPLDGLLDLVRENWQGAEMGYFYLSPSKNRLKLSTGGWPGNERVIYFLKRNRLFWPRCWYSSRRGGHHVFHLPRLSAGTTPHTGCNHTESFHGADGCLRLTCDCEWSG